MSSTTSSSSLDAERIKVNDKEDIRSWVQVLRCTPEELEAAIAVKGPLVGDVRRHLEQMHKTRVATKRVFYILATTGVILLLASYILEHEARPHPGGTLGIVSQAADTIRAVSHAADTVRAASHAAGAMGADYTVIDFLRAGLPEFCRDLGIAFLTAIVVATAFDTIYHKRMFIDPLTETYAKVQASYQTIQQDNEQLKNELTGFGHILATAKREGIVAFYRSNEERLKADIERAISHANSYLYIQGQTFKRLLVQGLGPDQSGIDALRDRLKDAKMPRLDVKICLSNTFDEGSHARLDLEKEEEAGSRKSLIDIFNTIGPIEDHEVCIRLTAENPMYGVLLTEDCIFIEHYAPGDPNASILVIKELSPESLGKIQGNKTTSSASKGGRLHTTYKRVFERAFRAPDAKRCSVVLNEYLTRKSPAVLGRKLYEREEVSVAAVQSCLLIASTFDMNENQREAQALHQKRLDQENAASEARKRAHMKEEQGPFGSTVELKPSLQKQYWCRRFGCSEQELIIALEKVAPDAILVQEYFKKYPPDSSRGGSAAHEPTTSDDDIPVI